MIKYLCSTVKNSLPGWAAWTAWGLLLSGPALVAHGAITHKYTFNDATANDSAGTANGSLVNGATITPGGQLALDGVNDYLNLPAATVAINTYSSATFESWFTMNASLGWQRLFDFGATNASGQGANYLFYSPTSGAADNRAALTNTDPGGGAEDLAIAGAPLSVATRYHVAVVVDQGAANSMSVYLNGALATGTANPVPLTRTLAGLSNSLAYVGRSTYNADPTLSGYVDEFRIHNTALTAAQVAASYQTGPDFSNSLALNVNTANGNISLRNTSSAALSFDYYEIKSPGGKLKPAAGGWLSLDDQNIDAIGGNPGESWDESGGSTANVLSELFLEGASTLAPGSSLSLGSAFNKDLGAGDLQFEFTLSSGELLAGKVNYVTGVSDADFNDDGRVDGADLLTWQRNFGRTGATPAQGDADGNGAVNALDLTVWKSSYGTAVGAVSAVPEPAACCLAVGFVLLAAAGRRSRA